MLMLSATGTISGEFRSYQAPKILEDLFKKKKILEDKIKYIFNGHVVL